MKDNRAKKVIASAVAIKVERVDVDLFGESHMAFNIRGASYDSQSKHTTPDDVLKRMQDADDVFLVSYSDAE